MNPAATLRAKAENFFRLDSEHRTLLEKAKATDREKYYSSRLRNAAREELYTAVEQVKQADTLVLNTAEEAKTFVALLSPYFDNRGQLRTVKLGTDRDESKRRMWMILEEAGLKLDCELKFKFELDCELKVKVEP